MLGLAYTPIWGADILHFYGFYFLIAAVIFKFNNKALLLSSLMIMLIFPTLMVFLNYDQNWTWSTFTYQNFWSLDGMIRRILFNGFHPVFPWAAFLVLGMWLGRQNLSNTLIRKKLFIGAIITLLVTEISFYIIRTILGDDHSLEMTSEEVTFLFSTSIIPPLPQYMISAACSAIIVLIGSLHFSEKLSNSNISQ